MEGASMMRQDGVLQKKAALKTFEVRERRWDSFEGGGRIDGDSRNVVINNCAYQLRHQQLELQIGTLLNDFET